jgi:hypothetical protein
VTGTAGPVLRAQRWTDNGKLVADLAALGYIHGGMVTLDPTYGAGTWWKHWRPVRLITRNRAEDGSDFTRMEFPEATFDLVAYDPPYVARGGRSTAGDELASTNERYGLVDTPKDPKLLQALINDGLDEVWRVLKPGGRALVKCQDYITGGRLWMGTLHTVNHAQAVGFAVDDYADLITTPRPQPHARQSRLRANTSRLWVLDKPRTARTGTLFP